MRGKCSKQSSSASLLSPHVPWCYQKDHFHLSLQGLQNPLPGFGRHLRFLMVHFSSLPHHHSRRPSHHLDLSLSCSHLSVLEASFPVFSTHSFHQMLPCHPYTRVWAKCPPHDSQRRSPPVREPGVHAPCETNSFLRPSLVTQHPPPAPGLNLQPSALDNHMALSHSSTYVPHTF